MKNIKSFYIGQAMLLVSSAKAKRNFSSILVRKLTALMKKENLNTSTL